MSAKCQKRTFNALGVEQLQQSLHDCGAMRGRHRAYQDRLAREGKKPGREPYGRDREIMAETGLSKASGYRALGS